MADLNPSQMINALAVRNAVVHAFLEAGKNVSIAEIAERLGWSVAKTRRVINNENSGAVEGTLACDDRRETYSKNYPGQQSGVHKVWTYEPSPSLLRSLITLMATNGGQIDKALDGIPLHY